MTTMQRTEIQQTLFRLGYYDGPIGASVLDTNFRDDLKRFQRDEGIPADGLYGPQSESKLLPYYQKLEGVEGTGTLPDDFSMRRWHLTHYYIGEEARWPADQAKVPMKDPKGNKLADVPYRCFSEATLEGTTKLKDGRLLNVAGSSGSTTNPATSPCDPAVFKPVFDFAKSQGWIPDKPGYAGIACDSEGTKAIRSRNFGQITPGPHGYPVIRKQECLPWQTLAADIGLLAKHDPKWKGLGGICSPGTRVFILEYLGVALPDGSKHDGWFVVNDTGGGIYGAHYDVFVGFKSLYAKGLQTPGRAHVWYEGIEARVPMNYTYGLA
jgi:hypothetical protein